MSRKGENNQVLSCTFDSSYFSIAAKLIQTDHFTQIHLFSAVNYLFFFQNKTVN